MLHIALFLSVFLVLAGLSLVKNPAFSFALYEIVYYFYPQGKWWGGSVPDVSYSYITVVIMAAAFVVSRRSKLLIQNKFFLPPQNRFIILILILFLVSTIFSPYPSRHLMFLENFLKLVITYFIAYKLIDDIKKLDIAIWGHLFGAWYFSFIIFQTGRNSGDRVEGIGTVDSPDANGLASILVPSLVFSFHYFLFVRPLKYKFLFVVAGVFIANALILVNSRGAFLGAAASVLYYAFYLYKSKNKFKHQNLVITIILLTALTGALELMDQSFKGRVTSIFSGERTEEVETERTRTFFWLATLEMAKDYPLGTGIYGFIYYSPNYIPENIDTGATRNRAVHSTWFEALSEIGYLGLLSLILMVFYSHRTIAKCRMIHSKSLSPSDNYRLVAIQAALFGFVITMTFLDRLRTDMLYWCILYTACAYSIYQSKSLTDTGSQEAKSSKNLS
jgi:hypothetical protein